MLEGFYRFLFTLLKIVFKSFGTTDFFFPFLAAFNIIADCVWGTAGHCFSQLRMKGKNVQPRKKSLSCTLDQVHGVRAAAIHKFKRFIAP